MFFQSQNTKNSIFIIALLIVWSLLGAHTSVEARQFSFSENVTQDYSPAIGLISGVAAADFDADGDIDFFVPQKEDVADLLMVNDVENPMTPHFMDEAASWRVNGTSGSVGGKPRSRAALWFDYDGDGLLDLVVVGDAYLEPESAGMSGLPENIAWTQPRLFKQYPDHKFKDVSDSVGFADIDMTSDCECFTDDGGFFRHLGGIAAGDISGDGYPELVVGLWQGPQENAGQQRGLRIFLNVPGVLPGTRAFEDITVETIAPGVPDPGMEHFGSFWQIVIHDFDGDGLNDIYGAVDYDHNHLWINQGSTPDPQFPAILRPNSMLGHDVARSAPATSPTVETDMGIALGDINNDLAFDFFITKTESDIITNDLYLNQDNGAAAFPDTGIYAYRDVAVEIQLSDPSASDPSATDPCDRDMFEWGWGCTLADLDRDGWVDLAMTNGHASSYFPRLMLNSGGTSAPFAEHEDEVYNRCDAGGTFGSTVIAADFDRDGDIDLIETMLEANSSESETFEYRLLWNDPDCVDSACPRWVVVRPRMMSPNSHAIGAEVRVAISNGSDELVQAKPVLAGTSMSGQEPAEAFFGLSNTFSATDTMTITVKWPNDDPDTVIQDVAGNLWDRVVHVGPCSTVDVAQPFGQLDGIDFLVFSELHSTQNIRADIMEPFGVWDSADLEQALFLISEGCP